MKLQFKEQLASYFKMTFEKKDEVFDYVESSRKCVVSNKLRKTVLRDGSMT